MKTNVGVHVVCMRELPAMSCDDSMRYGANALTLHEIVNTVVTRVKLLQNIN